MRPATDYKRPAVFIVNKLGDQLTALPAMRALGVIFPEAMQLLLGEGMRALFYRGLPFGEPVRVWLHPHEDDRLDIDKTASSAQPCDLFLSLTKHVMADSVELAQRLGASWTVGYSPIFDSHLLVADDAHRYDRTFAIPHYLEPSLRLDQFCEPPVFSGAAEAAAERYIGENCSSWDRILFLHPETTPERTWVTERFAWVIERFLEQRPEYMVVVASLQPAGLPSYGGRVIQTNTHLEVVLALMRHVDLFLGIDSCFLHAADLFRIPGVALFGPTEPAVAGFGLSPCFRHIAAPSMDQIRPEPVLEALLEVAQATAV
jgi:ADP-heptose:LPS heptosyltransferase